MIVLEKLYDSVETYLSGVRPSWDDFANEFKHHFGADMVLYRVQFEPDGRRKGDLNIIASSNRPLSSAYQERQLLDYHPIAETSLAPLEPTRRTDTTSDEEFRQFGPLSDFMLANGMFYLMMVPATLPDGSFVGLYVWRGERERDFDGLEKQRLALFMRHLLAVVGPVRLIPADPGDDVVAFGRTYGLTPAETKILSSLLQGFSLRSIARESSRSYGTVRWHVQNILEKCQVSTQRNLLSEFYRLVKQ